MADSRSLRDRIGPVHVVQNPEGFFDPRIALEALHPLGRHGRSGFRREMRTIGIGDRLHGETHELVEFQRLLFGVFLGSLLQPRRPVQRLNGVVSPLPEEG